MADKYNILEIERRIHNLISTKGNVLLLTACLPVDKNTPHKEQSDNIKNELNTIRRYVRMLYELNKDPHSFYYMQFTHFITTMNFSSDGLCTDRSYADRDNTVYYENFNTYFMDTVRNVLCMPQEMRDVVKTLFVGENYDVKLHLVKDVVKPDTLVIDAPGIEGVQLPFLPSVRKLKIVNFYKQFLSIDLYYYSLTDLHIETTTFCSQLASVLANAKCLESISMKLQDSTSTGIQLITDSLRARRLKGLTPIKSFRLIEYYDCDIPYDVKGILSLFDELSEHPLEVLGLSIPDSGEIEIMEGFSQLVGRLVNLEVLIIRSFEVNVEEIMPYLEGKIDNLESLWIEADFITSIETVARSPDIANLPNLKYLHLDDCRILAENLDLVYIERNRKNDESQPSSELMDTLPNTLLANTNALNTVGLDNMDDSLFDIVEILYEEEGYVDSDVEYVEPRYTLSSSRRTTLLRMLNGHHNESNVVTANKLDLTLGSMMTSPQK